MWLTRFYELGKFYSKIKEKPHNFSAYLSLWWESSSKIICTIQLSELQTKKMWSSKTMLHSEIHITTNNVRLSKILLNKHVCNMQYVCGAKLVPMLLKNEYLNVTVITDYSGHWMALFKKKGWGKYDHNEMDFL